MSEQHLGREEVLGMMTGFMPVCVLGAAAELDLWTVLGEDALSADELTQRLDADRRAMGMLLDAVVALRLLEKEGGQYRTPAGLQPLLSDESPENVLPMVRHRANIMRCWSQLAWTTKSGLPFPKQASIRGPMADRAAFIAAMHTVSGPAADPLVAKLGPMAFTHLLDVGGASGTWTMAFLRAAAGATATIFDLPDAIHQARERFAKSEFANRVDFVAGDFYKDDLPAGADFAWVSAIVHQHSREDNRRLFAKVHKALKPGGRIAIRDVVMEPSRTEPLQGALFAINMLVNTPTGGTFTFDELAEDLQAAGFIEPVLRVKDEMMNSVVEAEKP